MRHALALLLSLTLVACSTAAERADRTSDAPRGSTTAGGEVALGASRSDSSVGSSAAVAPAPSADTTKPKGATVRLDSVPAVVRALYVNRYAAQSRKRMAHFVAIADRTEINGLVLDMKDEFGLNYATANPQFAKNAGHAGVVPRLAELLDTLHAHQLVAIARIVVFKDSVTARIHPEWTIREQDGSIWRDKKGIAWVNPYHRELWEYNIGVAEELVRLGFDEIQFDYIRFPEPYPSLPKQVFPGADVSKPEALARYLAEARKRINALHARSTADVFGLVTTVTGALEVGQEWEKISPNVDVVLPMVYPSHYPRGSFGIAYPNADPYATMKAALDGARRRDAKLGLASPTHVRPWLQAFSLGKPEYGAAQLREEKRAAYDAGFDGWVMWSPGSHYDVFVPALDSVLVARAK